MRYSRCSEQVSAPGADVWQDHFTAVTRKAAGEDIIIMSVGDPDLDTPGPIVDAAVDALRSGDTHYTETTGRPRIRAAVAAKLRALTNVDYAPDQIIITLGCQNALFAAATLLLDPGDEAIAFEPMFSTYRATIQSTGASIVTLPSPRELNFQPQVDALEQLITPATRAILYASPANPTGVAITPDRLETIARTAIRHDLWVISDEVYCDLVYDGAHRSIASLPGMAERTVILGSLSKSHAMTGWRLGWAAAPSEFARRHAALNLAMTYGLPGFVQEAGAAALERGDADTTEIKSRYRVQRDRALAILEACSAIEAFMPAAGLFIMIDVSRTGLNGDAFCRRLLRDEGVSLFDGSVFGPSVAGTVRLCFAIGAEELVVGCQRIVRFAEQLVAEQG